MEQDRQVPERRLPPCEFVREAPGQEEQFILVAGGLSWHLLEVPGSVSHGMPGDWDSFSTEQAIALQDFTFTPVALVKDTSGLGMALKVNCFTCQS